MSANNKEFEEALNETVNKFADVMLQAINEPKNATNLTNAVDYLEKIPQIIALRKYGKALQLVKTKSKDNYNLALVTDSGTYEQYCKQFEYFLNDYKEKGGAFEIWEEDRFSFEEYSLLREVFVYEHR